MLRERLRRLFRPRRTATPSVPTAEPELTLHTFNASQETPLEEMLGVDGLTPVNPHLPTAIPGELEMQLWIASYLESCPDMFDEGTLHFLHPYLTAQQQLWVRASETAERSAITAAHRIRAANAEHLMTVRTRLAQLEHDRAFLARHLSDLDARLAPERSATP